MVKEKRNISDKGERIFSYQLKKFETLMKRRAGQYCLLDWQKRKIVNSNEDKKAGGSKLVKNQKIKEVIAWLKEINARLQKEDPMGGKILLTFSRLGREAKRLRKIKQLKEKEASI